MNDCIEKEIENFFVYREDKKLQSMMVAGYSCDIKEATANYIDTILNMPLDRIVHHIKNLKREPITAADVFQFSDFDDATTNLCSIIKCDSNKGLNYLETSIGLAFKFNDIYYLSPLGCVFDELDTETRDKLLLRLLLRNKLVSQLLSEALRKSFDMEAYLYDLSKSTYIRRRTNIKYVISIINRSTEYDFISITQNILY